MTSIRFFTDFDNPCKICGNCRFFPKSGKCVYCIRKDAQRYDRKNIVSEINIVKGESSSIREKFIVAKMKFDDMERIYD